MRNFTDNKNREWSITIDQASVNRVFADTGVDMTAAACLDSLASSPRLLAGVLYSLVSPQAERRGIEPEDFGRSLQWDAIAHATNALCNAIAETHSRKDRRVLRQAINAAKAG